MNIHPPINALATALPPAQMVGRFTFSTLHVCVGVDVSECVPLLWIVILTMASSSEISTVSYTQSGYGHLCLGIVVNSENEIYCFSYLSSKSNMAATSLVAGSAIFMVYRMLQTTVVFLTAPLECHFSIIDNNTSISPV